MIRMILPALCLCVVVLPTQASDIESMSLQLRKPLKSEMKQIDVGLRRWLKAWYSGDMEAAATHAIQLRDGYVLKTSLDEASMAEFQASLPEGYQKLDDQFYADAGNLVTATQEQDHEQMAALYGTLARSCNQCHAQFAAHRFKSFKNQESFSEMDEG